MDEQASGMEQVCFYQWDNGVKCAEVRKIPLFQTEGYLQIIFLEFLWFWGFLKFSCIYLFILCLEHLF